jgi:N-acetylmuramoyl-L-alanine amidase
MPYSKIAISSGHGKYVRGASGILDEVDEARLVVEKAANIMLDRGAQVAVFHDDTSKDQNTNLHTIVDFHNRQTRDLDVSVHFNAFEQTSKPMGVEVLYVTQGELAGQLSAAIAQAGGFINRGAKKRTDLYFLNNTDEPAILIEVCFVDSTSDANLYDGNLDTICDAIADVLAGKGDSESVTPPAAPGRVDIEVSGDVAVYVNGQKVC